MNKINGIEITDGSVVMMSISECTVYDPYVMGLNPDQVELGVLLSVGLEPKVNMNITLSLQVPLPLCAL